MDRWKPIETAPKDGQRIMAFMPSRAGFFARQDMVPVAWSGWGGGTWESLSGGHIAEDELSHWQPLPEPPKPLPSA
jgi:hypothetical protein